jgi:dephospho-CoA kinase
LGAPCLFGGALTRERTDVAAVGLTGGIGAGKSTALRFFADDGALTLSADEVVHQIYGREDVRRAVAERFGVQVLAVGGEVDRRRLAEEVRGRQEQLAWLEALTHPLVEEEILRFIREAPSGAVVVCEVPLLFEAGMQDLFDLVVTVEARADVRRGRSTHSFDLDMFEELDALQASSERRIAEADLSFFNDSASLGNLSRWVDVVFVRARTLVQTDGEPPDAAAPQGVAGEER